MMRTEPVKIELIEGAAKPWKCTKAMLTPAHLRSQANEVLDNLIETGMVRKMKNPTTSYMAPSFNVPKPSQPLVPRLVCDYTALNWSVKRPSAVTPNTKTALKKLPSSATHFLSRDLTAGYWQLALHEDSIPLTGFLTPEHRPLEWT